MERKLKMSLVRVSAAAVIAGIALNQSDVAEAGGELCGSDVGCYQAFPGAPLVCQLGFNWPVPAHCTWRDPDQGSTIGYCDMSMGTPCE
jgi:hypothetical protein